MELAPHGLSGSDSGMAAQVAAAVARGAAPRLPLSSEDEAAADGGPLGLLDLTTREVSLAGLEKEIEACGDSEVLRAILDQGTCTRWSGCCCEAVAWGCAPAAAGACLAAAGACIAAAHVRR